MEDIDDSERENKLVQVCNVSCVIYATSLVNQYIDTGPWNIYIPIKWLGYYTSGNIESTLTFNEGCSFLWLVGI